MTNENVTISFDLDGTLIAGPFGAVLAETAAAIAASTGGSPPVDPSDVRRAVIDLHHTRLAAGDVTAYDWANIVHVVASRFVSSAHPDLDGALARLARNGTRLLDPEAVAMLAGLRDRSWRVVIITNGYRRYQLPAIRAVGLDTVVDAVITADDVGVAKPDPEIFARAYSAAGPRVHIGDRVDHDVVGAHRSGAASVLIAPEGIAAAPGGEALAGVQPTAVVATLAEAVTCAVAIAESVTTANRAAPR